MTRQQLEQQLRAATDAPRQRVKMRGSNLRGYDFGGMDLTHADFSFSNLADSNFRGCTLQNAKFNFANVANACFENADLTGASFNFSGMQGANLTGADLTGVSMVCTGNGSRNLPLPTEPITLTSLLQKPVLGLLVGSVLGALLVYGASGIIYFTNLILTAKDPLYAGLNRFIAIQNLSNGIVVFVTTYLLSGWLDRQFRRNWERHLSLSILILPALFTVSMGSYFLLGKAVFDAFEKQGNNNPMVNDSAPWYLYVAASLLFANMFLYVLRQGKQLTRKMSEQEVQLMNLEKLKTRAELDALQAKINPHFLYNALNSIASLVHDNPDKAEDMTLLLSKLFRYSTGRDGQLFASLADELEMVKTYLQVEEVRFGNRLTFSVEVSNPDLIDLQLPQFLLQPIVENAIKHGIAKRADAGRVDVRIYEKNGALHLCVHDNGPAFPDEMSGGYGLRSIQDKLKLLYGDDARVEFQNWPLKQVLLSIKMERLLLMNDKQ